MSMDAYYKAVKLLPPHMAAALGRNYESAEEIRIRCAVLPTVLLNGMEIPFGSEQAGVDDVLYVLERATKASLHTAQPEIARGFINCSGGIRIGLCGTGIINESSLSGLRDISSVSIRIPHEVHGCGFEIEEKLLSGSDNLLVLSPPGGGKTTLLRECMRLLSNSGRRVCAADERGELAAVHRGVPQFDVGAHSDIMTGVSKAQAAMMLLRSMNPQVLIMDEISSPDDIPAACAAAGCGVRLIASAHAGCLHDLTLRPVYKQLLDSGIFDIAVVIENNNGKRSFFCEALK